MEGGGMGRGNRGRGMGRDNRGRGAYFYFSRNGGGFIRREGGLKSATILKHL